MNRYFGYVRVSTVKQGEHGVSLQEQRDAISAFAQRHGFDVIEWFEERETAAHAGRRIFNRMLKLLRSGRADGVILHKIDRGARNLKDWTELSTLCEEGYDVRFTNDNLDMRSRGGRLAADIQAVVAADYIRNLREETRKGFYGRLKQGLYPLAAPLGYLDRGKGQLKEVDPVRGPLVRLAFRLYATGRYTLDTLLDEVRGRGLTNRRGNPISRNSLWGLLHNPFYFGLIRLRRSGEVFDGKHEPLISKALFDHVQDVLLGRAQLRRQVHSHRFARLFKCAGCGYALTGELHKGHVYYRCHHRGCSGASVREEVIDHIVSTALTALRITPEQLTAFKAEIARQVEQWRSREAAEVESYRLELAAVRDRLNRLTDAFVDGLIDKATFDARKEANLFRRKDLEARLAEAGMDKLPKRAVKLFELAGAALIQYKSGIDAEKRELLQNVSLNRRVAGKNVDFSLAPAFQLIANRAAVLCSSPYRNEVRTFQSLVQEIFKLIQAEITREDRFKSNGGESGAPPTDLAA